MSDIVWEEPPRAYKGAGIDWKDRLLPLMKQPGKWARIAEKDTPNQAAVSASNLRRNRVTIPSGRWEFAGRSVDGKGYVYARYLGPEE